MKRKDFIKQLGAGAAVFCAGGLAACTKDVIPPVNFEVDLSNPASSLNTVGASKLVNGVLLIHYKQDEYLAFLPACTHAGTAVKYDGVNDKLVCPNHGAEFNMDGAVTKGPAKLDLPRCRAELKTPSEKRTLLVAS